MVASRAVRAPFGATAGFHLNASIVNAAGQPQTCGDRSNAW